MNARQMFGVFSVFTIFPMPPCGEIESGRQVFVCNVPLNFLCPASWDIEQFRFRSRCFAFSAPITPPPPPPRSSVEGGKLRERTRQFHGPIHKTSFAPGHSLPPRAQSISIPSHLRFLLSLPPITGTLALGASTTRMASTPASENLVAKFRRERSDPPNRTNYGREAGWADRAFYLYYYFLSHHLEESNYCCM